MDFVESDPNSHHHADVDSNVHPLSARNLGPASVKNSDTYTLTFGVRQLTCPAGAVGLWGAGSPNPNLNCNKKGVCNDDLRHFSQHRSGSSHLARRPGTQTRTI